jgi:hypothetical protein
VKSFLTANSAKSIDESEIKISNFANRLLVEAAPADTKKRIDLTVHVPERTNLKITTGEGEVRVSGDFARVDVETETGTISADVPLENLAYNFLWTASRPRFISDVELSEVKEKSAGRFAVSGRVNKETPKSKFSGVKLFEDEKVSDTTDEPTDNGQLTTDNKEDKKDKKKKAKKEENKEQKTKDEGKKTKGEGQNRLNFSTARGIVLLNVNPNEVPSDLRERPLTNAAKAIIHPPREPEIFRRICGNAAAAQVRAFAESENAESNLRQFVRQKSSGARHGHQQPRGFRSQKRRFSGARTRRRARDNIGRTDDRAV